MNLTKKQSQIVAFFYAFIFLLVVIRNLFFPEPLLSFIWFCDLVPLILFVAFLIRDVQFIKSIVYFGFIPQFLLLLDFMAFFVHGGVITLIGGIHFGTFADLMVRTSTPMGILVELILHIFPINLALLFTYKDKPTRKSLVYSMFILLSIYVLTLLFTVPSDNINYVFHPDLPLVYPLNIIYLLTWPILSFLILVLPTYWLSLALYKLANRKRQTKKR